MAKATTTPEKMSETEHSARDGSQGLTEGEQLGRDLAKTPQALRDGMSCFSGRDVSTALARYIRGVELSAGDSGC